MDILIRLQEIFRDIFDDAGLVISAETTASDIEDWDSLAQVNIIIACEKEFSMKFDINDISKLHDVGGMIDLIKRNMD